MMKTKALRRISHLFALVVLLMGFSFLLTIVMPALAADVWAWPFPTSTTITSGFRTTERPDHDGIDVGAGLGDPIYAPCDGTIQKVYTGCTRFAAMNNGGQCRIVGVCNPNHGYSPSGSAYGYCNNGYGNGILLHTVDGKYVQFAHMQDVNHALYEGQRIKRGTWLGYVGGSGHATGTHCHYAVSTIDEFHGFEDPRSRTYAYTYNKMPVGRVDQADGLDGKIRVAGWAKDEDDPNHAVSILVSVGGPAGSGAPYYGGITASKYRSDVGYHAYDTEIEVSVTGTQTIYVYAMDSNGDSDSFALLGHEIVNIKQHTGLTGKVEILEAGDRSVRVAGWAKDEDTPDQAVSIIISVGGPAGSGAPLYGSITASEHHSTQGNHGFDSTKAIEATGTQTIYVYAMDTNGDVNSFTLLGSKTVNISNTGIKGAVERIQGGDGTVRVAGWAKDEDTPDQAVSIIISVGGPAGSGAPLYGSITASEHHSTQGNHGFDSTKAIEATGTQTIYVYAMDTNGDVNSFLLLGSETITIASDTQGPVISNVQISDVSWKGYTVTCDVSDNVKVDRVAFPTWTIEDGQDDLIDDWEHKALGTISNGKATYRVNTSVHGRQTSRVYRTHIYAYDPSGNRTGTSSSEYPQLDVTVPSAISNLEVTDISETGYTVTCDIDPDWGTVKVEFPTWTMNNGQDDESWHQGTYSNGKASCRILTSGHNQETNCYYCTHIYATDNAGNRTIVDDTQFPQLRPYVSRRMAEPDFVLPPSLEVIEEEAFEGLSMTVVKCPDSLTEIRSRAFADCTDLDQIFIPENVGTIADTAFAGCGSITIFGIEGSEAEAFAARKGYSFAAVKE